MSNHSQLLQSFPVVGPSDAPGLVSPARQAPAALAVDAPEACASRRSLPGMALCSLAAANVVLVVALGALYVPIPPNPDGELFNHMGYVTLKGGVLYRDAGDVNMPGEPLLHLAALAAFGNHYWSYRLLDYVLLLAFVIVMGLLLHEDHGILGSLLFSLTYPIIYVTAGSWMSGQRDYLAAHAVTVAAFLLLRRLDRRSTGWPILSGALIGIAVLLKPTFAIVFPLLLAYDFYRVRQLRPLVTDAAALALGAAAVIGPLVVLGAVAGALQPWYEMTVLYSWGNYAADCSLASVIVGLLWYARISWHWYIVAALCGVTIWHLSRPRGTLAVTLIVGAVVVGSALWQKKGFPYHIAGALVVLTLLNVYFLTAVLRYGLSLPDRRARMLVLMLPLAVFGLGLASKCVGTFQGSVLRLAGANTEQEFLRDKGFDDVIAAARYIAHKTRPCQTVWPYTRHLMISTLADRRMPTRFSNFMFLRFRRPSPLADAWREEVRLTLERRPPELIVLERGSEGQKADWETGDIADDEPLKPLLEALGQQYHHEVDIGRFVLFRLTPAGVRGQGPA